LLICASLAIRQTLRQGVHVTESDAKTDRTPKALRAKSTEDGCSLSRKLLECVRVLASLLTALLFVRCVMILWLLRSFEKLVGPKRDKS